MPTSSIPLAKHRQILEMVAQGMSHREIAKALNVTKSTVSKYRHIALGDSEEQYTGKATESNEFSGDTWTVTLPKTRIHTLEQLLEYCKVDTKIWEVERFICNKWEMGYKNKSEEADVIPLFQVKAFLRKNKAAIAARDLAKEFRESVAKHALLKFPPPPKQSEINPDNLLEISLADHHFGALIWGKETGGPDYDTAIALDIWKKAFVALLERTRSFRPKKILLVFGHDQQNADNRQGMTEAGTPQTMDSRYQKVAATSEAASVWAVETCLGYADEVIVYIVPGNHDPSSAWHLGEYLSAWFRNTDRVKVNNSPNHRKYFEFGSTMLLFTHGNKGKLEKYPGTMASEQPAMWGRTKWREAHTGDKHHRRTLELPGATVRILPSLRPPDAWSSDNHYVGAIQAAEAYVWNKHEGLVGTAVYSVLG